MGFDITKVIFDVEDERVKDLIGKWVVFRQNLLSLKESIEHSTVLPGAILRGVDKERNYFCFDDGRYTNLIYLTERLGAYRPYKERQEVYNATYDRVPKTPSDARPFVWIRHKESGNILLVTGFLTNGIFADNFYSFEELFEKFEYLDGLPCGVRE
jgi:hypothetical protein